MCNHQPICPSADQVDRDRAHVLSAHPDQGWSLLCNGVVLFDDAGEILPDGRIIQARETTNLKNNHKALVGAGV